MKYTALIGHPVEHSISPILFAELTKKLNIEYTHLKIDISSKTKLKSTINSLKQLHFNGANITLPYKLDVIKLCNKIDKTALKTGAVNTIVFKNKTIIGYNTDGIGAFKSIEKRLKPIRNGDRILVIGAGGAARAIIAEIYNKTDNIIILNRTEKNAEKVSTFLSKSNRKKIEFYKLTNNNLFKEIIKADYIIQATSVGMYPNNKKEIIPKSILLKTAKISNFNKKYFFDAIFNPYETNLLINAKKLGAKTCSGTYMMIYQALSAVKIWFDLSKEQQINADKINKRLIQALGKY